MTRLPLRPHELLIALLCLVDAASAAPAPSEAATAPSVSYAGSETCAACHQAEYEEWNTSKHAGAFSTTFIAYRRQQGNPPECLACHTTGFDPGRRTYAFAGVSCESCHGVMQPDHPEAASMILPVDSSACATCHRQTFLEWQLSGHAKSGVRCFDCHAVHRQGLRQPETEQQCGACHAQRLEDFAHATHHAQGLTCATCHMPQPRTTGMGGTGAPGHSFFVGAETCAACHEEMVHKSHKIPTLTEQVEQLAHQEQAQRAEALQQRMQQLEWALDVQRSWTVKLALGLWVVGLVMGAGWLAWRRRRNGH
jgi:hypothetical protein